MLDLLERKAIFRASTLKQRLADPLASRRSIAEAMRGIPGFLPYLHAQLTPEAETRPAEQLLARHGISAVERHLGGFLRGLRRRQPAG
jgi:hypothetical protein